MKSSLQCIVVVALIHVVLPKAEASLIAHWRFEEGTAGAVAAGTDALLDSSGNLLHMTPVLGPTYEAVSNPNSTLGMNFAGRSWASRPDSAAFLTQSLTIEGFVRIDGSGASLQQILFRGDLRGGVDPYYLGVLNGRLAFNVSDLITDVRLDAPDLLPTGEFVHVAGTLDDATDIMRLFVNGAEVASRSAGGRRPDDPLFASARVSIGGLDDGFNRQTQLFNGVIDEVRLSDRALNPDEFLNARTLQAVPEPASVAIWAFLGLGLVASRYTRRRQK